MPNVLFVRNGTPGRFTFIAKALIERGWRAALINPPEGADLQGVETVRWHTSRFSAKGIYDPATRAEADIIRGRAAADSALQLRARGFQPDLIIGNPGWGEVAFLGEVFPNAKKILIGEFYYRSQGTDAGFDPEFETFSFDDQVKASAKNAVLAMCYAEADRIVVPTPFQASLFPTIFQSRITIIHEGIDTARADRRPNVAFRLPSGRLLGADKPIITFVNRVFEPMRGFHIFMRALPLVQREIPEAEVLLIGADHPAGYGKPALTASTWKEYMLREVGGRLDQDHVHFTGTISYDQLISAFSISTAHVYWTYPFVLSWSLLDAMACECLVIGSDTAPVRDVLTNKNGLLIDFFDHEALASNLTLSCKHPERFQAQRRAARETILHAYDRKSVCEPRWLGVIEEVMRG